MDIKNMETVAEAFKKLKFKKKLIGGVDEVDVWKKLEVIQKEYREAYEQSEIRLMALIDERDKEIARLKGENKKEVSADGE